MHTQRYIKRKEGRKEDASKDDIKAIWWCLVPPYRLYCILCSAIYFMIYVYAIVRYGTFPMLWRSKGPFYRGWGEIYRINIAANGAYIVSNISCYMRTVSQELLRSSNACVFKYYALVTGRLWFEDFAVWRLFCANAAPRRWLRAVNLQPEKPK